MNAQTVLVKTARGEQAIAQRSHELDRHLRYVLILVDGRSNVAELRAKGTGLPDFDESLQLLERQGFICPEQTEDAEPGATVDFAEVKEKLIVVAGEVLGADAQKVVKKLQAAPDSREGILEATGSCKRMVKLIIDEKKAEQLMLRCGEILENI